MPQQEILEAQVLNLTSDLAGKAPIASPTFTGVATTPALAVSGLTGAVSASRYVGATASGAPTTGTFSTGDLVVALDGHIFICTAGGTPGTWASVGGGAGGFYTGINVLYETQTAGTAGGTFTSGAWRTRTLNDVDVFNSSLGISISSNQISVPIGTYDIYGSAPAAGVDKHQARLRDITHSSTAIVGTTEFSASTNTGVVQTRSIIQGTLNLAGAALVEVQHICQTTRATDGFGIAGGFSDGELYTTIEFRKRA